jgi:hypothetical protein
LALIAGLLAFCVIVGSVARRFSYRTYAALILFSLVMVGLTLFRFYLDV